MLQNDLQRIEKKLLDEINSEKGISMRKIKKAIQLNALYSRR